MKHHGFTLLELLITVAILAIILAIAVPSFSSQIQASRTETARLELQAAIETARSLAVTRNKRSVLQATNEYWHQGWVLFVDLNQDGIQDDDEPSVQEMAPLEGVRISSNRPLAHTVSFIGTGEGRKPGKVDAGAFLTGTIKICPEGEGKGYKLVLSRGGRLRSEKLSEEDCAAAR